MGPSRLIARQGERGSEVSVIVPAYNAERHLDRTLDSLLAQRGVDLEVHVVDDRSTDKTRDIVLRYCEMDSRVRYSCTPTNFGGPAGPRNHGVESAHSQWVAFCDADDLWHPDKLRLQLRCAADSGAGLVCTRTEVFVDGSTPRCLSAPTDESVPSRGVGLWQMLLKNRVATSSVMCRRDALLGLGGFNIARGMIAVEDYDLWLRLMTQLGVSVQRLEQPLVAYRLLPGSLSASKRKQALKILRVHRSVFITKGWRLFFPLIAPILMGCYITSWLYIRRQVGRYGGH